VVLAWSTPGAALIAATSGIDIHHAVGAFIVAGGLIALTGAVPALSRAISALPARRRRRDARGRAPALRHGGGANAAALPALILPLVAIFLVVRLVNPLYATLATLAAGIALAFTLPGTTTRRSSTPCPSPSSRRPSTRRSSSASACRSTS
jgi:benzoate membrane transport protein